MHSDAFTCFICLYSALSDDCGEMLQWKALHRCEKFRWKAVLRLPKFLSSLIFLSFVLYSWFPLITWLPEARLVSIWENHTSTSSSDQWGPRQLLLRHPISSQTSNLRPATFLWLINNEINNKHSTKLHLEGKDMFDGTWYNASIMRFVWQCFNGSVIKSLPMKDLGE